MKLDTSNPQLAEITNALRGVTQQLGNLATARQAMVEDMADLDRMIESYNAVKKHLEATGLGLCRTKKRCGKSHEDY